MGQGRSAIVDGINFDVPEAKYFGVCNSRSGTWGILAVFGKKGTITFLWSWNCSYHVTMMFGMQVGIITKSSLILLRISGLAVSFGNTGACFGHFQPAMVLCANHPSSKTQRNTGVWSPSGTCQTTATVSSEQWTLRMGSCVSWFTQIVAKITRQYAHCMLKTVFYPSTSSHIGVRWLRCKLPCHWGQFRFWHIWWRQAVNLDVASLQIW